MAQALEQFHAGDYRRAEHLFRNVLQLEHDNETAWFMLAYLSRQGGRNDDAADYYAQVLRLKPDWVEALNNRGNALTELGRFDEAIVSYRTALKHAPDYFEAHNGLGVAFLKVRNFAEAASSYQQAIRLQPSYAAAHLNLGTALKEMGKFNEAVDSYRRAVSLQPAMAMAHNNLGTALAGLGKHLEAIASYEHALQLDPGHTDALINLGISWAALGKLDIATDFYKRAVQQRPNHDKAYYNLGVACAELDDLQAAVASYRRAIDLNPNYAEAWDNLGCVLVALGQPEEALACHDRALRVRPDYDKAYMSRGVARLRLGDYAGGWPDYESRYKLKEFVMPSFPQPRWNGERLDGKTILLAAEQGLGDTLQFVRYAAPVRRRCAKVIVACQKALIPLLSNTPAIDQLFPPGVDLPQFDAWASLLSLPGIMRTTLETIPADVPYLFPAKDLLAHWQQELQTIPGFKVGICWQGNPDYKADRERSIPLAEFAPLAPVPGVQLISLQKGHGAEQVAHLSARFPIIDLANRLDVSSGPLMDTAAVMKSLDLIITADTAIAHLAGGLGAPVWIALPYVAHWCWLWDRDDSPWYPAARLFRQPERGNWKPVFTRLAQALRDLTPSK
jgi:tetratricopeptide (TPR) repeat protein